MRQAKFTQDFTEGMKHYENVPAEKATRFLRAIASHVGEALIVGNEDGPGTPVDTGNARGHWYPGGEEDAGHPNPPALGADHKPAASAEALTGQALADAGVAAATMELGDVLSFNNDAAYIEELNNGSSQQAPLGITDVVASNFDAICEREAQRLGIKE